MQVSELEVGNTPTERVYERIVAKKEYLNPFGSMKDRIAYEMIKEAEKTSILRSGKIILEATSGNTGIGLAGFGSKLGYQVEVVVPEVISEETKKELKGYGAKLFETPDDFCPRVGPGTDQAIALVKAILDADKDGKYVYLDQYSNEANFLAHYRHTGPEIWNDLNGKISNVVIGIGTGGSSTGIAQYLKERNPNIRIIGVQGQEDHHIQGLKNLKQSGIPSVFDRRRHLIDKIVTVTDREAYEMAERLNDIGYDVGPSSGAVMAEAEKLNQRTEDGLIVVLFVDKRERHLSSFDAYFSGKFQKEV